MNKKMLGDIDMNQSIILTSIPFLRALDYWREINDIALAKGTREQREYLVRVTERVLSFANPKLKEMTLPEITHQDLVDMYKILANPKYFPRQKVTTRKKWQKFITSIFNHLFKLGIISKNPAYAWATESGKSEPYKMIDPTTIMQIIRVRPSTPVERATKLLLLIGLDTGLRLSSLTGLSLEDLEIVEDVARGKVIRGIDVHKAKRGNNYRVTVSEVTSKAILEYIDADRNPKKPTNKLLLTSRGTPLLNRRAAEWIDEFCAKYHIPRFNPHCLRVTYATFLAHRTKNTRAICTALGVRDEATAIHYIREAEAFANIGLIHDNSIVQSFTSKLESELVSPLDTRFSLTENVIIDENRAIEMQRDGGYYRQVPQDQTEVDLEIEMLKIQMRILQLQSQKNQMASLGTVELQPVQVATYPPHESSSLSR